MRRDFLHLSPLISILLFPVLSYGQSWSGVLAPNRAIDWSTAGLPKTLPDGESTLNPWTPPTRVACTSAQAGTTVPIPSGTSASVINNAISACAAANPNGSYLQLGSGTFSGGMNIAVNNVTLRGMGASSTHISGSVSIGNGMNWGGASLLTASPAKGATSVSAASAPSSGRIAAIEQCDSGFSASDATFTNGGEGKSSGTRCTGSYSDPLGIWVCGHSGSCDTNSGSGSDSNPHEQGQVVWIPAGGVSGSTVNLSDSILMPNWSTGRSASLMWLNNPGVVGSGVEDLSVEGSSWLVSLNGTYASWVKGVRIVSTQTNAPQNLTMFFDSHSLVANSYIAGITGGANTQLITWGSISGEQCQSGHLFINNIVEGGWGEGGGCTVNTVWAYNYFYRSGSGWTENGEFQHAAGTSFLLREGNQMGKSADDATWGSHNLNTWFRNWVSDDDPPAQCWNTDGLDLGSWSRFENVIGNVLGSSRCAHPYGLLLRVNANNTGIIDTTGLTQGSAMIWGNYALCSGDAHCNMVSWNSSEVPADLSSFGANATPYQNPLPSGHNLPSSFFMNGMTPHPNGGTGLSWWKVCTSWISFPTSCASYSTPPFPPFGPDVTGGPNINGYAYNVPAAQAWMSLPTDPAYGNAIRQFDESVYQSDGAVGSVVSPPTPPTGLGAVVN